MTAQDPLNLIWIDLEMTGLDPERERIIEIATVVTDANLNVLAEGPSLVVHQQDTLLDAMDESRGVFSPVACIATLAIGVAYAGVGSL